MLNVVEVFGNIMVEYDYFECIILCVMVFSLFRKYWFDYCGDDIDLFIRRVMNWIWGSLLYIICGVGYGGWYGSWGVCFIYVIMFGFESFVSVGEIYFNFDVLR